MLRAFLEPALAAAVLAVPAPATGAERLGVRPGMGLDAVTAALSPRCTSLSISAEDHPHVTCSIGEGDNRTTIEVTLTARDRAYFVRFREASASDVSGYVAAMAAELGFRGPGEECRFYDYPARCWRSRDGTVLYAGERDAWNRYVTYLVNERIKDEDEALE